MYGDLRDDTPMKSAVFSRGFYKLTSLWGRSMSDDCDERLHLRIRGVSSLRVAPVRRSEGSGMVQNPP